MTRVSEVTRNVVVVLGGDSRPVRRTISTVGRGAMAMAPMASSSRLRSMAAANARRVRMVSACWWCGVGGRAADAAASLGEMLRWAVAVIAMASGAMAEFVGVGKGGGWGGAGAGGGIAVRVWDELAGMWGGGGVGVWVGRGGGRGW